VTTPHGLPDGELVRRIQGGDNEAFQTLFDRYLATLEQYAERWLPRRLRRRVSVMDVLQEAQIVALDRSLDFEDRGEGSFRNWLLKIVELKVKETVRRHEASLRSVSREVTGAARPETGHLRSRHPTPSQVAIGAEAADLARRAMEALPDPYREVLRLAREECLTLPEISKRMGRSSEAVRKLLGRALSSFTAEFERLRGTGHG